MRDLRVDLWRIRLHRHGRVYHVGWRLDFRVRRDRHGNYLSDRHDRDFLDAARV